MKIKQTIAKAQTGVSCRDGEVLSPSEAMFNFFSTFLRESLLMSISWDEKLIKTSHRNL